MNRRIWILIDTISLFFLFIISGNSQFIHERFERIGIKDGLPQASVNYILQDSRDFIWFATYGGLSRYDGYSFTNYTFNPDNRNGLSNQNIVYLCEDRNGDIWAVSSGSAGIDRYNPVKDKFTNFRHDPSDPTSLSSDNVLHVMEDRNGDLWISTDNAINLLIDKGGSISFKRFYLPIENISPKYLYESKENLLFLFSPEIYVFDRDSQQFLLISNTLVESEFYQYAVEDNDGCFVTANEMGLIKFKYNRKQNSFEVTDSLKISPEIDFRNVLCIDKDENIWIANSTKGLFRCNFQSREVVHFHYDEMNDYSLSEDRLKSLFIDKTGVLWIGTSNMGVCKLDLFRNKIDHYKFIPDHPLSLNSNLPTSIHSISEDELWIGYRGDGGVNRLFFDEDDRLIKVISYKNDPDNENSLGNNEVNCIIQRRNGDVWTGFNDIVVARIIPEDPGSGREPVIINYGVDSWTFALFEDSDHILWGGTWGAGLWRFDDITEEFTYFAHDPSASNSIADNVVWALYEDNAGNIWVGGNSKGISIIPADQKEKQAPVFINYSYEEGDEYSLINNTINAFLQHTDGTLWIATSGGLVEVLNSHSAIQNLKKERLKFRSYTIKDGLPSNSIIGIVEDKNGDIWLSTIKGVSFFNVNERSFTNYYESDGFQGDDYVHNSSFINSKGRIFFGGVNGISAFFPENIKPNPFIPEIRITGLKIFNKEVKAGEEINGQIVLEKSVSELSELVISHKNNFFTLEFAALHFANTHQNKLAYYLEGYDKEWHYLEDANSATYMNLPAGEYTLRIRGSNNNGIWNETGTSLKIIIKPPFWKTLWFRLLVIVFTISLIFLIYYLRIRNIRRQNRYLEARVKESTKELRTKNELLIEKTDELNETNTLLEERQQMIEEQSEELRVTNEKLSATNEELRNLNSMKDKFFSIIGHDLKNPIGAVIGYSEILQSKIDDLNLEKRNLFIHNILRASNQTFRLLENLLEWARSQSGRIEYSPTMISLGKIINENILLIKDQSEKKDIDLIFENNITADTVFCDIRMISTVVRNLISNGVKFTPTGGQIKVYYSKQQKEKNMLVTCIQDNGIGIPETELSGLFELDNKYKMQGTSGEEGSGLGLLICKEFIEKNRGKIWVESAPDKGTTFYFSLPVSP